MKTAEPIVTFKPIWCLYCEHRFAREKNLVRHLEKKHDVPRGGALVIARTFYLHALGGAQ